MSELPWHTVGCEWPVDPACLVDTWDGYDEEVQDRALSLAGLTLRRLTGYRVGGCPVVYRPCTRAGCGPCTLPPGRYGTYFTPGLDVSGNWVNSCGCTRDCEHSELDYVDLPMPVGQITEVKVDGVVLDEDDWHLDLPARLYRVDGDKWPAVQDMGIADSETGTFSITYLNAYPVDALGAYAAGILAMEYAKACTGGKCRLPETVTSITRQGVSYEIPTGAFPNGMTGLKMVDTYIAMWNPGNLRQQPRVWSPDLSKHYYQSGS